MEPLLIASDGIAYPEPLLPEIGGSRDDIDHALPAGPDGDLHAYADGADTTLCGQPLTLLHTWPNLTWPGGLTRGDHCPTCTRDTQKH
jgi:hypothetical protein